MLIDPEHPRLWIALLAVHITAGAIAVTVGVLPLVSRKGGGFHCRWGRVFGWSMTIVVGAAALLSLLAPRPAFVVLTLSAGLQLFSGLRVLGRKRPDLDPAQRAIALDWGVTLGILAGAGVTAVWVLNGGGGYSAVATWAAVGGVFVFGLWDLLRFAAPTGWPFFPRLWFYEHLTKMTGVLGAAVSAASGNILRFLPDPWRQLWPIILFQILIVAMIVWYATRRPKAVA
jgi:hypothetical protein